MTIKISAERVLQRYSKGLPPEFLEQQKKMKEKSKGKDDGKKDDSKKDDKDDGKKKEKGKGKIPPQFLAQQKKNKEKGKEAAIPKSKAYSAVDESDVIQEQGSKRDMLKVVKKNRDKGWYLGFTTSKNVGDKFQ